MISAVEAATNDARVVAARLFEEARGHKRAASFHRKAAREGMERLADFCRKHGLALVDLTKGEGEIHGRETDPRSTDGARPRA